MLLLEETGTKKGMFLRECEVILRQSHGKSYFIREISTGNLFLRVRNRLRPLKEAEPSNIAVRRLEHFTIEMTQVKLHGIMKHGNTKGGRRKGVSFDGTCHVHQARLLMTLESP